MLKFLRVAVLTSFTSGLVVGAAVAGATPLHNETVASSDSTAGLAPRGALPGEVGHAQERPRRRAARIARSAEPPAAVLGSPAQKPAPPPPPAPPAPPVAGGGTGGLATRTPSGEPVHFASVEGMRLRLPGGVRALGFHEVGGGALPMHPIGRPSHNMGKLRRPPVDLQNGSTYLIMRSRGRGGGPTSAVDIAMPQGWPLQSPVTGTVEVVQSYRLYGRLPDYLVRIIPDARPDLRVKLLHLDTVHVAPGHRVVEGESIIAGTARQLPVQSQVDRYADYGPHVHLEVVRG